MTANVIDGNAIAKRIRTELKLRADALGRKGVTAGLAVVLVGDNPASRVYVRNKARACVEAGLHSEVHELAADATEPAVLATLDGLNRDPRIHGIILQLPLPPALAAGRIVQAIAPDKDVDGLNWRNLGALLEGRPVFVPCTPLGVMALLDHEAIPVEGRHAVVIGRSVIVGKPMALLLIARGATVTVCNSKTPDLAAVAARADILVVAAGRPGLITADMVKREAAVIDVGINRLPDGKLAGDVNYPGVLEKAGWLTPVPGGVGPLTVAMVLANTLLAAERAAGVTALR